MVRDEEERAVGVEVMVDEGGGAGGGAEEDADVNDHGDDRDGRDEVEGFHGEKWKGMVRGSGWAVRLVD
ncbi:MAG: hypothetical protein J6386_23735 [Candidatus Synoicihabitans palmerolidicus]|nr:hypothetical protein [Candidatus Synoicihabitans palmerolidicus]